MTLLERDWVLDLLADLERNAANGHGSIVFLGGEAGAGKSSVVHALLAQCAPDTTMLVGACDSMPTPGQLWPLHDLAQSATSALRDPLQRQAPREAVFRGMLAELSAHPGATIAVIEDAHWADDATLDLLRFIGRRIESTRGLVIVTFRDDDLAQLQRLRLVLGDLATNPAMYRLSLPPLSRSAVATLADGRVLDIDQLYQRSGGNAFYVTELLAAGGHLPAGVSDAVTARISRLSPDARNAIELAAMLGESSLLQEFTSIAGDDETGVQDAIESGALTFADGDLRFRHALVRDAVVQGIAPLQRAKLASRILDVYLETEPERDPAVLAHFAEQACRFPETARYASAAAQRAADLRSYREAAAQYQRALKYSENLTIAEHSALLRKLADVVFYCGNGETDIDILRQLTDSYRALDDQREVVTHLLWLGSALYNDGFYTEFATVLREADRIAGDLGDTSLMAETRSALGELAAWFENDLASANRLFSEAITLAAESGNSSADSDARVCQAIAQIATDETASIAHIEQRIESSKQSNLHSEVAADVTFLGNHWNSVWQLDKAERVLTEGRIFTEDVGLDCWFRALNVGLSRTEFARGNWTQAAAFAASAIQVISGCASNRFYGYLTIGRVRTRRGDPEARQALDLARAAYPEDLQPSHAALLAVANVEAAFLSGKHDEARDLAMSALPLARELQLDWMVGELNHTLLSTGAPLSDGCTLPGPYAHEAAGDWAAASRTWQELGAPYEAARAQAMLADEAALRAALAEFDRLGAQPMCAMVSRRLRELGAGSVPRGPRSSTRSHPYGLTAREAEILAQLGQGWTNSEIATRLFLSPRTVEHHVSSILAKMDVSSRHDAVRIAHDLTRQPALPIPA